MVCKGKNIFNVISFTITKRYENQRYKVRTTSFWSLESDERDELGGLLQVALVLRKISPLFESGLLEQRDSGNLGDEQVDGHRWQDGEVLRASEHGGGWKFRLKL